MGQKKKDRDESALQVAWEYKTFAKFYFLLQIIFIILFGTLVEYEDTAKGVRSDSGAKHNPGDGKQLSNFQYIKYQVCRRYAISITLNKAGYTAIQSRRVWQEQ